MLCYEIKRLSDLDFFLRQCPDLHKLITVAHQQCLTRGELIDSDNGDFLHGWMICAQIQEPEITIVVTFGKTGSGQVVRRKYFCYRGFFYYRERLLAWMKKEIQLVNEYMSFNEGLEEGAQIFADWYDHSKKYRFMSYRYSDCDQIYASSFSDLHQIFKFYVAYVQFLVKNLSRTKVINLSKSKYDKVKDFLIPSFYTQTNSLLNDIRYSNCSTNIELYEKIFRWFRVIEGPFTMVQVLITTNRFNWNLYCCQTISFRSKDFCQLSLRKQFYRQLLVLDRRLVERKK